MNRFERWWRAARPKWWSGPAPTAPARLEPTARAPMKISHAALERFRDSPTAMLGLSSAFTPRSYPPGVLPGGRQTLAMDSDIGQQVNAMLGWGGQFGGMFAEGIGFMGYPYLAELTQRAEYRRPSEIIAEEMTRKWVKLTATGDDDKSDKLAALEDLMQRFKVREVFRDAIELDGFFGRSQIYLDVGDRDDQDEQRAPLLIRKEKIEKGSLKGFTLIDPTWTAPNIYNAMNPRSPSFYKPQTWWVMGDEIHTSRLLTIVSRPVPDILKPAYNFGGVALSQMLKPYVDNWLRTRQSVSDLVQAFTTFVLETNLEATLQAGGASEMEARIKLFTAIRNNLGVLAIDKETEGFQNVSAPLGGLDHLQAQAQEHMAAVSGIPLVKAFGITPSGLNASSDGEIRVFYDTIHARQERVLQDPLMRVLRLLQLHEFGEIDEEIGFEFLPLWQLDEAGQASVDKTNADADAVRIESSVITPGEVRETLRKDDSSRYQGLEGPAPEMSDLDEVEGLGDPAERIGAAGEEGRTNGANSGV